MSKYVQNSVVKISMMSAKYFEYYTIILRAYSIIGSGFTVNLGSDSLGKSNDIRRV